MSFDYIHFTRKTCLLDSCISGALISEAFVNNLLVNLGHACLSYKPLNIKIILQQPQQRIKKGIY